jgi:transposase-like protein
MQEALQRKSEGAPARAAATTFAGDGAASGGAAAAPRRFSAARKLEAVTRLLRGEPLEVVARDLTVTAATLSTWRERALGGALTAMKERERDARDDDLTRLKAKLGEVTMANELLEQKIARLESQSPLARRRSRR